MRMPFENSTIIGVVVAFFVIGLTMSYIIMTLKCKKRKMIGKPTNLKLSNVECESVTLEWTKPKKEDRHIKSYTIFCRSNNDPWQSKMTSTKEKVKITNLTPRTRYVFKVRAEGSVHGKESDATDPIKTKPKYPGKPCRKPVATHVTQNGVSLKWGEPEFGAEQVVRLSIYYRSVESDQNQWKKVVERNICIKVIGELEPETRYIFKVSPESEFGPGPESDLSEEIKTDKILSK